MASNLKLLTPIIVPLLINPVMGTELTYKEYAKASEVWKRRDHRQVSRPAKLGTKDLLRMQGISPMTDKEYAAKYHRPLA